MYLSNKSVAELRQMLHAGPEEPMRSAIIIHINSREGRAYLMPCLYPAEAFKKMSYARLRQIEESELVEAAEAEIDSRESMVPGWPE